MKAKQNQRYQQQKNTRKFYYTVPATFSKSTIAQCSITRRNWAKRVNTTDAKISGNFGSGKFPLESLEY